MNIRGSRNALCLPAYVGSLIVWMVMLSAATSQGKAQVIGSNPTPTLSLTCSASPLVIYPGDPVTITGVVVGFAPEDAKKLLLFKWTGDSKPVGSDDTATLIPQAAGPAAVHGNVSLKSDPTQFGECDLTISVKPLQPPTISCSANPSIVQAGEPSAITASGVSPGNRPLTYNYSASAGAISGSGTTATLSTAGVASPISVTCLVEDDKGQQASATTLVTISLPAVPSAPPPALPPFAWPPPRASVRVTIPLALGGPGLRRMGELDKKILSALTQMGYVQRAHYSVPNGYVLITRVEQIGENGVAKPEPYRFSDSLPAPDSVKDYLGGLFTSRPGYFRIIAFVVTNVPFNDIGHTLNEADASALLNGPAVLPGPIAAKPLLPKTVVTALIYEYQKTSVDRDSPAVPIHSAVSAQTHLERAGLWQLLSNP